MMKTTIERLGDTSLKLEVEVPEEEMRHAIDHVLAQLGRELNIPGFRPGKVPPQAVMARLGREHVTGEAVRTHLDEWYRSAVVASGIRPVAAPEVDLPDDVPESGPLSFTATVEVAKRPTLPELSSVEVERPKLPDTAEYEQQVLDAALRGAGTLVEAGRAAEEGDEVVVDFRCTVDGEDVVGAGAVGYQARLGDGRLLGELEEAIVGSEAGSDLEVEVDFPADHPMSELAGQHATFHLKLREVLRLELPELTDEVAARVSEHATADALRDDIRAGIRGRLEEEVQGIFRGNAVQAVAEAAEVEEPQQLVEARQQEMYSNLRQQLAQAGLSIEQYLDRAGKEIADLLAELEQSARDDLRRELVLLALAEDAGVEVTEEHMRAEVAEHAEQTGQDADEAMETIRRSGRMEMLRGELLIQKTIDHLVEQVKPVEVEMPTEQEAAEAAAEQGEEPVAAGAEAEGDDKG